MKDDAGQLKRGLGWATQLRIAEAQRPKQPTAKEPPSPRIRGDDKDAIVTRVNYDISNPTKR